MTGWLKLLAAVVALLAIAAAATVMVAGGRWRGHTEGVILELRAAAATDAPVYDESMLCGLPPVVARYFARTLRPGQPMVRSARLRQTGEFLASAGENGWRPFEATEFFTALPPAFVWDARITMAPLLDVRVRDQYRRGEGRIQARLASLLTVMEAEPSPELASGALMRYLAEAVWLPTALLPANGVQWEAIDEARARATLADGAVEVSLEFTFDDAGDVVAIYSPARFMKKGGDFVPTPWAGSFANHEARGGMRVPLTGEVAWVLPSGRSPYWRGRIERIDYELAR